MLILEICSSIRKEIEFIIVQKVLANGNIYMICIDGKIKRKAWDTLKTFTWPTHYPIKKI